jgi:Fe-Mn family superoxide dismutase
VDIGCTLCSGKTWHQQGKGGGGKPGGAFAEAIDKEFGSFERFKAEFTKAAVSAEGSGWAALAIHGCVPRPVIMQIEKHNTNIYPGFRVLMALDVFEHAYYIDYKNDRAKFVETFWNIVAFDIYHEYAPFARIILFGIDLKKVHKCFVRR